MEALPAPEALAATEVIAYLLADLAIILIAARLVGGLFAKMKQPRIVGEMISGILIGPTVLGGQLSKGAVTALDRPAIEGSGLVNDLFPLQSFAFLNLFGLITLIFFMLLVGLEVEQHLLKGRGRQIAIVAGTAIAAPVALGFLVGAILDEPGKWLLEGTSTTTHALFIGAGLAVTAFPVMARILQEKRMLDTPMGAIGVGSAAVVTPLMFLVVAGASASAKGQGVPGTIGVKLLLAIGLVVVLFVIVRPLLRWFLEPRFKAGEPLDGEIFAVILVGALVTALAADRIGIHSLNGGFLFGACVPQIAGLGRAVVDRMLQFVVVFMIPIFLAVSGLQTDLTILKPDLIIGILIFLAAMVVAKLGASTLAGRAVGLEWREAGIIGALMNCRGLMILVVALIAVQAGAMTPELQAAFVLGAIVTTLMTGPLVDLFLPKKAVEAERDRSVSGASGQLPAMTGGPRVMVAPGSAAGIAPALAAAEGYTAEDGPKPQFLVVSLPGLEQGGEVVGAGPEEARSAVGGALRWLEPAAAALRAREADAAAAAFQSPEPGADLARLAGEWAATNVIVGPDVEAGELEASGLPVARVG